MTVYVICPEVTAPSGGVQKLYDHVDILNRRHIPAAIVHRKAGYRADWFDNHTSIDYTPVHLRRGDLLAVPEVFGDVLASLAPGVPRVSVNQNGYLSFRRVADRNRHPYTVSADVLGVMVMSEDSQALVRGIFPGLDVRRVRCGLDPAIFFDGGDVRGRVLSYMPRKRADDIDVVLRMAAPALEGWEKIAINAMSQREVADALRRSALFLSFSQREGFGMPPLEALACGCYVIGFDGCGGREYFDQRFTTRIEDGDLVAFSVALGDWLRAFQWTPRLAARAAEASSWVLKEYSREREEMEIVDFYNHYLDRAASHWDRANNSVMLEVPSMGPSRWRTAGSRALAALRNVVS